MLHDSVLYKVVIDIDSRPYLYEWVLQHLFIIIITISFLCENVTVMNLIYTTIDWATGITDHI